MKPLRLVALVALLGLAPPAASSAAPVPAARDTAKERLEGLKKRLPALVASWEKKHWGEPGKVEVRLVRMVGPGEAKATFYYHARGSLTPHYIFSVWLTYHDGRWTTRRSVVSWPSSKESHTAAVHLLMLAIDESEWAGVDHFIGMIRKTALRLTDEEIAGLRRGLEKRE